jgi:hypothetical protein
MALVKGALSNLAGRWLTSIHGRKLGLDGDNYLVGHSGDRMPLENSTAASTLANYGISVLSGTTSTGWTLNAPPSVGARKVIINNSSDSTATLSIVRSSSASGVTFLGSTAAGGVRINLLNNGSAVDLVAISSAIWAIQGTATFGSTPYVTVSTSS